MRTRFPLLVPAFLLLSQILYSQAMNITGEYQLRGVPETAAGFSFSPDSTFKFFLSYGAADRYASGTYTQKDGKIMLAGDKIPGKDFAVTKSSKQGKGTTIKVNAPNEVLKDKIICIFYKNGQPELNYTDRNGISLFPAGADSVQLVHQLYPDEPTVIVFSKFPDDHNSFELSLQPSMEQLSFMQIPVEIKEDQISIKLSWLMGDKELNFYKVKKE